MAQENTETTSILTNEMTDEQIFKGSKNIRWVSERNGNLIDRVDDANESKRIDNEDDDNTLKGR